MIAYQGMSNSCTKIVNMMSFDIVNILFLCVHSCAQCIITGQKLAQSGQQPTKKASYPYVFIEHIYNGTIIDDKMMSQDVYIMAAR